MEQNCMPVFTPTRVDHGMLPGCKLISRVTILACHQRSEQVIYPGTTPYGAGSDDRAGENEAGGRSLRGLVSITMSDDSCAIGRMGGARWDPRSPRASTGTASFMAPFAARLPGSARGSATRHGRPVSAGQRALRLRGPEVRRLEPAASGERQPPESRTTQHRPGGDLHGCGSSGDLFEERRRRGREVFLGCRVELERGERDVEVLHVVPRHVQRLLQQLDRIGQRLRQRRLLRGDESSSMSADWLDLFGKDTSPKAINVLTFHVPPFGNTDRFKAFAALVRRDVTPTNREVKAEMHRMQTHRCKRARKEHRQAERVLQGNLAKVASFVADFVAAHGYGPTWSEVGEAHGWVGYQRETVLRDLQRSGWVTATQVERSLRPGAHWRTYSASQRPRELVGQCKG
jgi:hypothetical protein